MYQFVTKIKDLYVEIFNILDTVVFDVEGMNVSFLDLIFGFLVISFVITVFWKGAKA